MNGLKKLIQNEPTGLVSLVRYIVLIGIAYGLKTSDEQLALILGFVELVLFLANRAMVTPVTKAEAQVKDAKADAKAEAIVERAMSPAPTTEEWATVQELRAERDRLTVEQLARDRAARGRTP